MWTSTGSLSKPTTDADQTKESSAFYYHAQTCKPLIKNIQKKKMCRLGSWALEMHNTDPLEEQGQWREERGLVKRPICCPRLSGQESGERKDRTMKSKRHLSSRFPSAKVLRGMFELSCWLCMQIAPDAKEPHLSHLLLHLLVQFPLFLLQGRLVTDSLVCPLYKLFWRS